METLHTKTGRMLPSARLMGSWLRSQLGFDDDGHCINRWFIFGFYGFDFELHETDLGSWRWTVWARLASNQPTFIAPFFRLRGVVIGGGPSTYCDNFTLLEAANAAELFAIRSGVQALRMPTKEELAK